MSSVASPPAPDTEPSPPAEAGVPAEPQPRPRLRRGGRRRRRGGLPWLRASIASTIIVGVLSYYASEAQPPAEGGEVATVAGFVPVASAAAPPPVWQAITKPLQLYGLDAAEVRALPLAVEARRHASGTREDTLVFGDVAAETQASLHLVATRRAPGHDDPWEGSLFVDLARAAARAALSVARSAPGAGFATKFGEGEAADVTLLVGESVERPCLAFRTRHPEVGFGMVGWLCGTPARPADRIDLACLLDRLELLHGGDDPALRAFFAQAERRRGEACPAPGPRLTATGRRTTWLEPAAGLPALKGR